MLMICTSEALFRGVHPTACEDGELTARSADCSLRNCARAMDTTVFVRHAGSILATARGPDADLLSFQMSLTKRTGQSHCNASH